MFFIIHHFNFKSLHLNLLCIYQTQEMKHEFLFAYVLWYLVEWQKFGLFFSTNADM